MPHALDPRRPSQTAPDRGGGGEAFAKLQPSPTLLSQLASPVTDALVSKHVQLQIAKGNRDADCWAPKVRCTC